MAEDYVQLVASEPVVIPEQHIPAVTYDKYWMTSLRMMAPTPLKPVNVIMEFAPARDVQIQVPLHNPDGTVMQDASGVPMTVPYTIKDLQPGVRPKRVVVNDVFTLAASNSAVYAGINDFLNLISILAQPEL